MGGGGPSARPTLWVGPSPFPYLAHLAYGSTPRPALLRWLHLPFRLLDANWLTVGLLNIKFYLVLVKIIRDI